MGSEFDFVDEERPVPVACNERKASCHCIRAKHEGHVHVCDCGGAWNNEDGSEDVKVYSMPEYVGYFSQEQAEAFAQRYS